MAGEATDKFRIEDARALYAESHHRDRHGLKSVPEIEDFEDKIEPVEEELDQPTAAADWAKIKADKDQYAFFLSLAHETPDAQARMVQYRREAGTLTAEMERHLARIGELEVPDLTAAATMEGQTKTIGELIPSEAIQADPEMRALFKQLVELEPENRAAKLDELLITLQLPEPIIYQALILGWLKEKDQSKEAEQEAA